ncbi:hypothetical protein DCS_04776 [Drechmeria coniospora]|uniref:Uncharacterized protein n=1 Tax=Drechmeria coniospora TaxID=98403 RepID=A0A151GKW8_DRECN|nr:hypothetical protein DCS_04776 [Drechmeria coniospora]KYK57763.1 hypothetical protein DCS_04776 [Drechmeria coniospora]
MAEIRARNVKTTKMGPYCKESIMSPDSARVPSFYIYVELAMLREVGESANRSVLFVVGFRQGNRWSSSATLTALNPPTHSPTVARSSCCSHFSRHAMAIHRKDDWRD